MAPKRGRPSGKKLNPAAVEHLLPIVGITKLELATSAGMTSGHLADCLHSAKGVSDPTAHRLALALRCDVGVICPEVTGRFVPAEATIEKAS